MKRDVNIAGRSVDAEAMCMSAPDYLVRAMHINEQSEPKAQRLGSGCL